MFSTFTLICPIPGTPGPSGPTQTRTAQGSYAPYRDPKGTAAGLPRETNHA